MRVRLARSVHLVSVAVVAAMVSGCVALGSRTKSDSDNGVVYYLPKSILTITVRETHDIEAGRKWYEIGGETTPPTTVDYDPAKDNYKSTIGDESVPDLKFRYSIKYRPSAFSDDRVCITRRPDGLLNDVIFASDDRTPEIAFNIARAIAGAMPRPPTPVGATQQRSTQVGGVTKTVVRDYTSKVDPFDEDSIYAFNNALRHVFGPRAGLKIDFHRMREQIKASQQTWPEDCKLRGSCPANHWVKRCGPDQICYRTKLKLPVDLLQHEAAIDVNYASIINAWDIGAISVTRAVLVHKLTKLRFQDGALIAAVIRKPSEVEEATLLPLHVVNAALSVPSGLWASTFGGLPLGGTNEKMTAEIRALQTQVTELATAQKALYAAISPAVYGTKPDDTKDLDHSLDCLGDPTAKSKAIKLNIIQ